ncbi:MAG TPA: hypothetical protein VLH40_07670 [Atribacteraceae bacterium]|nr:hypothetical protein [Atribacteraceae bacterium]
MKGSTMFSSRTSQEKKHTGAFLMMRNCIAAFLEKKDAERPHTVYHRKNQRWTIEGMRIGVTHSEYTCLSQLCRKNNIAG